MLPTPRLLEPTQRSLGPGHLPVSRTSRGSQVAVLVNDMAEVSIDAELLARAGAGRRGGLVALANGCICCTLRADLVQARRLGRAPHASA